MSLASYIGCQMQLPLSVEDSQGLLIIGPCFSDLLVKKNLIWKANLIQKRFIDILVKNPLV